MSTPAGLSGPLADPALELTSFVGRDQELADLERLLAAGRLLTLTGAGGSGKTRLALELVSRVRGSVRDVAWVELAALGDPALIPQHVAEAFGVRDEVRDMDALLALVRAREALLVLDNCEHLVDACADLAHALLRGCPDVRILATSREALGVKGERAWLVPPLSLPSGPDVNPEEAESFEAVRLFVERARDVLPDFALTAESTHAVVDICRRLDGIPLAIELAAARVRVLPPQQIRERLDQAFQLLTAGGRTAVPRHRTLRATIDWSHDLLQDSSKVLLRRAAVFRGGFTLDAAEAVCAGDGIGAGEVLDLVARLVDRSMLVVREHQGFARYQPLETVRQYALERLSESGDEEPVRRRHAEHMLRIVEEAASHATTPRRRAAFERLLPEADNLREALLWTREHEPHRHIRLAGKLGWFWFSVGHWTEARRWVAEALMLPEAGEPGLARAELLFSGGAMATLQADVATGRAWLTESAALAEAAGAGEVNAYALNYLGMSYAQEGRPEARVHCGRAEAWFRENGDDYGLRLALMLLGLAAQAAGEPAEAVRLSEEGVAVARRFGQARELSSALQNLGNLHAMQGSFERAEPVLLEALAAARRDPLIFFISATLDVLGEVRLHQGRLREAGRILGAAESMRAMIGAGQFSIMRRRLEPRLAEIRAGGDAALFEQAVEAGRQLPTGTGGILDELLGPADATGAGPRPAAPRAAPEPTAAAPASSAAGPPAPRTPAAAEPAPDLRVSALGPLEVVLRGEVFDPDAWPYAKPRELLVFLMLHPAGRTREQIGHAIWPGASAAQVKNSFHVTLHHLRKALGASEWVVIEGDRYRLAPTLRWELDADRFERAARAAREGSAGVEELRHVLALYRGELLEGEVVGPWVEDHRDRLRRLMVDTGLALGAALEAEDDPAGAAEAYYAIAAREELNEDAQRRLMLAWSRAGDRVRALRHYERLVALLRDELDAEPEPETVRVFEALRQAVTA